LSESASAFPLIKVTPPVLYLAAVRLVRVKTDIFTAVLLGTPVRFPVFFEALIQATALGGGTAFHR
jgi:hypothetical protein